MPFKYALAVAAASGLLVASAAAPGLAKSPAEPDAKTPRHCFWTRQIDSFASTDNRIINIRVGVNDYYQLEMLGRCGEVDWADGIAIRSRGSTYICTGIDIEVISPTSIGPERCAVKNLRKLTAEEVKTLPKHSKP